ncbi:GGDEF domain-containing protein [Psychromonas sp. KJ10-10]|uniref:GGDEF domain-containing protein n=1 Tax=Psychromonas sp. KJ10-10 TaxID=3391823 RepID=UPI0039B572E5
MNRLEIVSGEVLDSEILNKIHYFDSYYQNQVIITADYITHNDEIEFNSPVDFLSYLENGINALEQLNTITNDIVTHTASILESKYQEALIKLVASILLSLLIFIILFINIFRIYKLVYRRVIVAGKLMHELSMNNTDITIPEPLIDDEIGGLESGLIQFKKNILKLNNLNMKFEALAHQDSLTNLLNHESVLEQLEKVHREALRYQHTYCAVMVDIDWFKQVNDSYGHQIGDEVLQTFANLLNKHIRETDLLGRYGGEEFLIIFSHTSEKLALKITQKIKHEISDTLFSSEKINITASFGIAELRKDCDAKEIIRLADNALYEAKNAGRNRIIYDPK